MTLQEQFNAINRGTGNKEQFLKHARNLFPQYLTKHLDYNTSINVLKTKQIISEQTNVVTKGFDIYDWKKILAEETEQLPKRGDKYKDVMVKTGNGDELVKRNVTVVSVDEKERKVLVRTDAGGEVYLSFNDLTNSSKPISESVKAEEKETSNSKFMIKIYKHVGFKDDLDTILRKPTALEDKPESIKYFDTNEEAEKWWKDNYVRGFKYKLLKIEEGKYINESIKIVEKETSKEVKSKQDAYDATDVKNADNINGNEIWKGYYVEMKDPANADKTGDELKKIVVKNLSKDPLYYTKNGMFGIKGVGYTTEAPGLGEPKAPKGKYKSSGYGDVEKEVKVKSNVQDSLGDKEAKTSMPKKVKEMSTTPQNSSGVKKMKMPGAEKRIKLKEGLSLAELLAEPEENSLNEKMNDFNNYPDSELIQLAKDEGMEELIVLNPEGGLENRDELLSALTKEADDDFGFESPFCKSCSGKGCKECDGSGMKRNSVTENSPMEEPIQESKLRSIISKLIREELN